MIVFTAITPHPPVLIPTIGKDSLDQLKQTTEAMNKLKQDLTAANPEVILIISPHGQIIPDAFSINLSPTYKVNFEEFGDFATKLEFKSNPKICLRIKERMEDNEVPCVMTSKEALDHGAAVPLYFLTENLKNIPIIPISFSFLDYSHHFKFGQLLKREIVITKQRIAVIASGDMSHCLTKDAPGGYSPKGEEFDKKVIDYIKNKQFKKLIEMDPTLVEEAGECGLRSFIMLHGLLEEYNYQPEILSYEAPFGVGYMVANFKLT